MSFCQYVDLMFETPPHIRLAVERLQQVERYIETKGSEGIGRLLILMPPRHGKSELGSRKLPAWLLGKLPDSRIILTSYGADLATKNSRDVRDVVMSSRYQAIFGIKSSLEEPVLLSSDSRSVSAWDLAQPNRGGVTAAGVGGGITGLGADLLVIDDPFKNREEAESEGRRELVDDWYKSSAHTRLERGAAVVGILTRWHADDWAGRMIKRMIEEARADQWEIVFLPATALADHVESVEKQRERMREGIFMPMADALGRQPGKALWPERYGVEWLEDKKANIGAYEYEALYQQMPYLREGGLFKRNYFDVVNNGPGSEILARVRYWDKAASRGGDRTAGVRASIGIDGYLYIEHVICAQMGPYERDAMMVRIGKEDYEECGAFQIWHQQDPGSAGLDSAMATNDLMADAGLIAHYEPVSGQKVIRAQSWASKAEEGGCGWCGGRGMRYLLMNTFRSMARATGSTTRWMRHRAR